LLVLIERCSAQVARALRWTDNARWLLVFVGVLNTFACFGIAGYLALSRRISQEMVQLGVQRGTFAITKQQVAEAILRANEEAQAIEANASALREL
jgi:hypothetical protein